MVYAGKLLSIFLYSLNSNLKPTVSTGQNLQISNILPLLTVKWAKDPSIHPSTFRIYLSIRYLLHSLVLQQGGSQMDIQGPQNITTQHTTQNAGTNLLTDLFFLRTSLRKTRLGDLKLMCGCSKALLTTVFVSNLTEYEKRNFTMSFFDI